MMSQDILKETRFWNSIFRKKNHQFLKRFTRRFIFIDFELERYPLIINSILKDENSESTLKEASINSLYHSLDY